MFLHHPLLMQMMQYHWRIIIHHLLLLNCQLLMVWVLFLSPFDGKSFIVDYMHDMIWIVWFCFWWKILYFNSSSHSVKMLHVIYNIIFKMRRTFFPFFVFQKLGWYCQNSSHVLLVSVSKSSLTTLKLSLTKEFSV